MQKRSSDRPSQKSYTQERPLLENVFQEAREQAINALIERPNAPAAELAIICLQNVDPAILEPLKELLVLDFFRRTLRAERRKQATATRQQLMLPGFEALPQVLPVSKKGPPIRLMDARYADLRAYCWLLASKERQKKNSKLKQAEALRDKMKEHASREPGITVRQVLLLEQL